MIFFFYYYFGWTNNKKKKDSASMKNISLKNVKPQSMQKAQFIAVGCFVCLEWALRVFKPLWDSDITNGHMNLLSGDWDRLPGDPAVMPDNKYSQASSKNHWSPVA